MTQKKELQGERKRDFARQAAKANYLCLDRPDISIAVKEAMRKMSASTVGAETALKKIGRYLVGNTRLVGVFGYGEGTNALVIEGDSDRARCVRTTFREWIKYTRQSFSSESLHFTCPRCRRSRRRPTPSRSPRRRSDP